MTAFLTYLLKVVICSGLLTGYYYIALRNRAFYQWNRFYLLSTVVLSLTLPLTTFTIFHNGEDKGTAIQLLEAVGSGDEYVVDVTRSNAPSISLEQGLSFTYLVVSAVLLITLTISLLKIISLIKKHAVKQVANIQFINTEAEGTPFSFFHYIFWNPSIDLDSENGKRIFQHELAHVRERHSLDKLLLQLVMVFFWCNPFFWIIRYELRMIHEFIADRKALDQQDASALAAMILQAAYPTRYNQLINSFFHQSIKRRIHMLTKKHSPRLSYISRILFIPLAACLVLAFSVRTRPADATRYAGEKVTVVIDPGHGGTDAGARHENLSESDLTLAIARAIQALNSNENIEIVLTRSGEENISLQDRVAAAQKHNAALFISLHVDAHPAGLDAQTKNTKGGIAVMIPRDSTSYLQKSKVLGSVLVQQLGTAYTTTPLLFQRKAGVFVLNKNICPAVMVDCGYITHEQDRQFITQKGNQKLIAQKILNSIETYLSATAIQLLPVRQPDGVITRDTVPVPSKNIQTVHVTGKGVEIVYKDGSKANFTIAEAEALGLNSKASRSDSTRANNTGTTIRGFEGLVVVDGKEYTGDFKKLDPNTIQSVNVLKGAAATAKYGDKAKNGAIEITLKSSPKGFNGLVMVDGNEYKEGLDKIDPNTIQSMNVLKGATATEKYGSKGAEGVIEIILKTPTTQTNNEAPAASSQSPAFTLVEVEPRFPGGTTGWRQFLEKNLKAVVPIDKGAPAGTFTVMVQLLVEKDGTLSEVKPLTTHGYGMEEEVVRTMKLSPRWEPARQNGHTVRAYKKQPITFVISSDVKTESSTTKQ